MGAPSLRHCIPLPVAQTQTIDAIIDANLKQEGKQPWLKDKLANDTERSTPLQIWRSIMTMDGQLCRWAMDDQ